MTIRKVKKRSKFLELLKRMFRIKNKETLIDKIKKDPTNYNL